jgi:hypothetical protein
MCLLILKFLNFLLKKLIFFSIRLYLQIIVIIDKFFSLIQNYLNYSLQNNYDFTFQFTLVSNIKSKKETIFS